ncbi:hypothetical protein ACFQY0_12355 [Haloferula chungangensis]|uniref:CHASE2 domain-containing protein n=1 Tax=Haloferula chungangensis TaxID=1048331 RepID=A0ABW2L8S6_9BACT
MAAAVASLGVGLLLLAITPKVGFLEEADRKWFGVLSGKGEAVVGQGTLEDPRRTEEIELPEEVSPAGLLFLDDDHDEYFEATPPVPTDLAVVFSRLKTQGVEHFGVGYPLGWKEPDTLALEAMRAMMDRLEGTVLGFQLNNGTVGEPVPVPFQRCSIAYAEVGGDRSKLPVVNSLQGETPEFGGEKTRAGFTLLGNEDDESERAYLLARWDDRVVFSLPLASAIVRLGVPLDQVKVEAGKQIRLGAEGPRIPIDFRGRIKLPTAEPELLKAAATAVISKTLPDGFGEMDVPVYLVDSRLGASKFEREWGEMLPRIDSVIRSAPRRVGLKEVPRPEPIVEMLALVAVALVGAWLLRAKGVFGRMIQAVFLCGLVAAALAAVIRYYSLAPLPLAFQMVPVAALLMVMMTEGSGKIEVVRAKSVEAEEVATKPPKKGKRRKR